ARPRTSGLLPGLVRHGGGLRQVHERDARALLDLRQRYASTDLRPVCAKASRHRRRTREPHAPKPRLASRRRRRSPPARGAERNAKGRPEASGGFYIPIAWYPEST